MCEVPHSLPQLEEQLRGKPWPFQLLFSSLPFLSLLLRLCQDFVVTETQTHILEGSRIAHQAQLDQELSSGMKPRCFALCISQLCPLVHQVGFPGWS